MLSLNILFKEYNDWVNEKSVKRYKIQLLNMFLKKLRIVLDLYVNILINYFIFLDFKICRYGQSINF